MVFLTSIVPFQLQSSRLRPLGFSLLRASGRCALQLFLSGALILTPLLATTTPPPVVAAWLCFTGAIAARESAARVAYVYPRLTRHLWCALNLSLSMVLVTTYLGKIISPTPWYNPRTWIPIAGMLMGNAVTSTALAANALTRELATQQTRTDMELARGATLREALGPVIETCYRTALTPTINALSVTGIVHIPGLMTGQLLGNSALKPSQAAMYQILIFFLIAATSCTSVQTFTRLCLRSVSDKSGDRLRLFDEATGQVLLQPKSNDKERRSSLLVIGSVRKWFGNLRKNNNHSESSNEAGASQSDLREIESGMLNGVPIGAGQMPSTADAASLDETNDASKTKTRAHTNVVYRDLKGINEEPGADTRIATSSSVLQIENMLIDRTAVSISLNLSSNDVVGIQGPSGIGKSQLLRTVVGLEALDRSSVKLSGRSAKNMPMSQWRKKVALVPQQQGLALEGTPRDFFNRVLSFESQKPVTLAGKQAHEQKMSDLVSLLFDWNLSEEVLDRNWSTLSGGEAQRVSLAISICLRPSVILLDEPTSALDQDSTLKVEATLKSLEIPILIVSHDVQQVERLCNRVIDLVPSGPLSMKGFR